MIVGSVIVLVVAGFAFTLGAFVGGRVAIDRFARELANDPDKGIPVMESLARRFGAKLEMLDTGGGPPRPPGSG